jgi:transcriptional regulator with XRE-family HTH domain
MTTNDTVRRLREERLNRGLTQAGFADAIGVSERVIQAAELGRVPYPGNARKVAEALGTTVTALWPVEQPESGAAA